MVRKFCVTVTLALTACAARTAPEQPAGDQPAERAAVLAVMDAYMHEISANDLAAMDARQTPEGMTYRHVAREDGGWDEHRYRERYWSPTVMIRGAMALVWAPYEFQIDGATSHCGVDVFSFAKVDGEWKVSNSMWTVEPNACAELRPADASTVRPND